MMDVGFGVTISAGNNPSNMAKQQNFIKAIARAIDVSAVHSSRLGLLSYGDGAFVNVKFRDQMKLKQFEKAVNELPSELGLSSVESALKIAASSMFTEASGTRFAIPKVFVLVIDNEDLPNVSKGYNITFVS